MSSANVPRFSITYRVIRPFMYGLAWLTMALLGRYRVVGRYRLPKTGAVLILSNHQSDLDPIAVQLAARRHVFFMAKSELFDMPSIAGFLRLWNAFPVKRGEPDRTSIKHAVSLLKAGCAVCIYPEGQLSEDGELLPILPGALLIARMAGCPVIGLGLKNTRLMMPYSKVVPRFSSKAVSATWGEIHSFPAGSEIAHMTEWVREELTSLTSD